MVSYKGRCAYSDSPLLPPPPLGPQVSPQSLAMLREMGYKKQEASRALRFCSGDVASAVAFIAEQRVKKQVRGCQLFGGG